SHYGFSATLSVVRWSKARHFAATYRVRREQMQMSIPSPLLKAPSLPGQFSCSVSWLILQWLSYFGYCIFRANDETLICRVIWHDKRVKMTRLLRVASHFYSLKLKPLCYSAG